MELLVELSSCLLVGLMLGGLIRGRLEFRKYVPTTAVKPYPVAGVDHRHTWEDFNCLHDPESGIWLYNCTRQTCRSVLRTSKQRETDHRGR